MKVMPGRPAEKPPGNLLNKRTYSSSPGASARLKDSFVTVCVVARKVGF
jgi:hypothetical protein